MRFLFSFILKHRFWLCPVLLLASVLLSVFVPDLRIEEDEATWFTDDDPVLQTYRDFQSLFEAGEMALVAYRIQEGLTPSEASYLGRITRRLEDLPHILEATSLTNVDDLRGDAYGLTIRPLLAKGRKDKADSLPFLGRVVHNPFLDGVLISADREMLGIALKIKGDAKDKKRGREIALEAYSGLQDFLKRETAITGRQFHLGGNLVTDSEVAAMMEQDMYRFFPSSLLVSALLLAVIFRSILQVVFPLIAVSLALLWTLALKGMLGSPITPVSTTLFALITVIGIANSIHLISHYRNQRKRGVLRRPALEDMFMRAGRACFFTSLTTALGFGSLGVSSLPVIRDMGLFAAFGILCAFLFSMILIPFGLGIGRERDGGASYGRSRRVVSVLGGIAVFNQKHSGKILFVSLGIFVMMLAGIPRIRVESSLLEYLKPTSRLRKDAEILDRELSGISSFEITLEGEDGIFKQPEVLRKIEKLQESVRTHPAVASSYSLVDYVKWIQWALREESPQHRRIPKTREAVAQSLMLFEGAGGSGLDDYVTPTFDVARVSIRTRQMEQNQREALLQDLQSFTLSHFAELKAHVTGFDHLIYQTTGRIVTTQIRSLGLAFLVILGVMILLFGWRGGLVSILPNALPIVFLMGFMGYLGFRLNVATAIIASIAIGIVVDDTIHYFTHFRFGLADTQNRKEAMLSAHRSVGGALCYTTAILGAGFLIFLFSTTRILMDYGLLSFVAVVVALAGDLLTGPSLLYRLKVFGKGITVRDG